MLYSNNNNENVVFNIDDKDYYLEPNKLWFTDVNYKHWVKNNSDIDRIHLVIDFKPTIEIMFKIGLTHLSFFKKFYFSNNSLINKRINFKRINLIQQQKSKICLIMCQWKRFHTFNSIIQSIMNQTILVDVYIWNNNYDKKEDLLKILNNYKNININIYLYNSPYNIKCIGRLISAHLLRYLYDKIIFFDDEIMVSEDVIETFDNETNQYPNTIFSWWAHNIISDTHFYKRINMQKNNNTIVNYGGGGGCIIPSKLFSIDFMNWLPYRYFNVEDLLCNIYIHHFMKGNVRASNANITFIKNESVSKDSMSFGYKLCNRTNIEIHKLKDMCLQWGIKEYNYPIFNPKLNKFICIKTKYGGVKK